MANVKVATLCFVLAVSQVHFHPPEQSRATTPGASAESIHPKSEPKQESAASGHMGAHMGAIKAEPKQEVGSAPLPQYGIAASQAGPQAAGGAGQQGSAFGPGQQGTAPPQQATTGQAGTGPSPRPSGYQSRRSPSPLPMRSQGDHP